MKFDVIKLGGNALINGGLEKQATDIANRASQSPIVLVHGAGPAIDADFTTHGFENRFVDGIRYTPKGSELLVVQSLIHQNTQLVYAINRALATSNLHPCAVGITGSDGELLQTSYLDIQRYGMVGKINSVNSSLLEHLLSGSWIPVIAPFGCNYQLNQIMNVNADTAASAIARSLKAEKFILITNVPGILDKEKNRLTQLSRKQVESLIEDGTIVGGMLPKIQGALEALTADEFGVLDTVVITDSLMNCGTRISGF